VLGEGGGGGERLGLGSAFSSENMAPRGTEGRLLCFGLLREGEEGFEE